MLACMKCKLLLTAVMMHFCLGTKLNSCNLHSLCRLQRSHTSAKQLENN
jgi:hypothetical protein